jgi:hypothetical protein
MRTRLCSLLAVALLVGVLALGNPWLVVPDGVSALPSAPIAGPESELPVRDAAGVGAPSVAATTGAAVVETAAGTESETLDVSAPLAAPASTHHDER